MKTSAQWINQTSGAVEYYTPSFIIEAARKTMDGIDLDPASSEAANRIVGATLWQESGSLEAEWFGRIWLNHPFSRQWNAAWINKLVSEFNSGRVKVACCITYACTSEAWFRPLLQRPQCFLIPRTNFLLPDGSVKRGVTKGSVVTYFGPDVNRFAHYFQHLGEIKEVPMYISHPITYA